jgi:hypothetical protein
VDAAASSYSMNLEGERLLKKDWPFVSLYVRNWPGQKLVEPFASRSFFNGKKAFVFLVTHFAELADALKGIPQVVQ